MILFAIQQQLDRTKLIDDTLWASVCYVDLGKTSRGVVNENR